MEQKEKIEYVKNYLQSKISEGFSYPFKVSYEDGCFEFCLTNGKRECRARSRQTEELVECICDGTREEKEEKIQRLYQILEAAVSARDSTALSDISDYAKVKSELILRPLNYALSREELKTVPHIRMGDVALVLYAVMAHAGEDYFTAKMHREQMTEWHISEEEILEEALVNTSFLYPPRLYSVEDLLSWDGKKHDDGKFMDLDQNVKIHKGRRGYILTNTLEINGAVALFYPGVARKIADFFDDDFYIAFTSIHEAQLHSACMISPSVIRNSLRDTNRHCNRKEEILTNKVYCYNRQRRAFCMLEGGQYMEVRKDV